MEGKREAYNGSRIWFHLAMCPSIGTFVVFAIVSRLVDTVTKNFLFMIKNFLILGTFIARRTK